MSLSKSNRIGATILVFPDYPPKQSGVLELLHVIKGLRINGQPCAAERQNQFPPTESNETMLESRGTKT